MNNPNDGDFFDNTIDSTAKADMNDMPSITNNGSNDDDTFSELIWQRKWLKAKERAELYSQVASTEIYLPPEKICKALPLHLALSMRPLPPSSFVRFLIECYPNAAQYRETTRGLLPLHFACMSSIHHQQEEKHDIEQPVDILKKILSLEEHINIIQQLIHGYPEGVRVRESFRGMLPIHLAAAALWPSSSLLDVLILAYPKIHLAAASIWPSNILDVLVLAHPESVFLEDEQGDTPLDIAIKGLKYYSKGGNAKMQKDQNDFISALSRDFAQQRLHFKLSKEKLPSSNSNGDKVLTNKPTTHTETHYSVHEKIGMMLQLQGFGMLLSQKIRLPFSKKRPSPFFEVSLKMTRKSSEREEKKSIWKVIYRSHPIMRTANPTWDLLEIDFFRTLNNVPLKLSFFDCNKKGPHQLIGEVETTLDELLTASKSNMKFTVKKQSGKKNGLITILNTFVEL